MASQPTALPQAEASPAPQSDLGAPQQGPDQSMPHAAGTESAEQQGHETEDTDAPGNSAAHSKPVSQGWGRLKKVKLAAQAEGSQVVGSKRRREQDPGDNSLMGPPNGICIGFCLRPHLARPVLNLPSWLCST